MPITLITGVPGTGKTAYVVNYLKQELERNPDRVIFVDNITGLLLPHYRAGKITEWQKGTWLHIDQYKRTTPAAVPPSSDKAQIKSIEDEQEFDVSDGNENWLSNPNVSFDESSNQFFLTLFDDSGNPIGKTRYESHKGALLVIDECQRYFRPRPAGSPVPDFVAALEVHRHQGLDILLITQRPQLVDSNVRALCGRHIALRSTSLGRYQYEWPEVGDIDSKASREVAARTRYRLPKDVFSLYKSAEVHTKHKHKLPMAAYVLMLALPIAAWLVFSSVKTISSKASDETAHKPANNQPQALHTTLKPPALSPSSPPTGDAPADTGGGELETIGLAKSDDVPRISSCIANAKRCQCYDADSVRIVLPEWECRKNAQELTHDFNLDDKRPINTADILQARPYVSTPRYEPPQRDEIVEPANRPLMMSKY